MGEEVAGEGDADGSFQLVSCQDPHLRHTLCLIPSRTNSAQGVCVVHSAFHIMLDLPRQLQQQRLQGPGKDRFI